MTRGVVHVIHLLNGYFITITFFLKKNHIDDLPLTIKMESLVKKNKVDVSMLRTELL